MESGFCRSSAVRVQRRLEIRYCLVLALIMLSSVAAQVSNAAGASHFVMRNDNPFAAMIGVPGRWPDQSEQSFDASFNIANHSIFRRGSEEFLLLDGETHRLQLRYQKAIHPRINLGMSLAWVSQTGGFLDSTIDAWHGITGLREGIRPNRPRDQLTYSYGRETFEIFGLSESASGLGDTQIAMTVALNRGNNVERGWWRRLPVYATFSAELPTGDLRRFTGNEHTDIATGLRVTSGVTPGRWQWAADVGVVYPGDVDVAGLPSADAAFYYDVAVTWRWLERIDLALDIAGNSRLYTSEIEAIGDAAAQFAAGLVWRLQNGARVRVGFYEDLRAESASDFGLELGVTLAEF